MRRILAAAAASALFAALLVVGLVLHVDLPVSRRVAARIVNDVLASELAGSVRIERIDRLSPTRLELGRVIVDGPRGERVLDAPHVTVAGPGWLGLLALAADDPSLVLAEVKLAAPEVALTLDERGRLAIAEAFQPRPSGKPPTGKPPKPRRFQLWIRRLALTGVRVRGELPLATPRTLDGAVEELAAELRVEPLSVRLEVERARVREVGILGAPLAATVSYSLRVTAKDDRGPLDVVHMRGEIDGTLGRLALAARASQDGDRLDIDVTAPRVGRTELAPWVALPVASPVLASPVAAELHARLTELSGVSFPKLGFSARLAVPAHGEIPRGLVEALGDVRFGPTPLVRLELSASELDLGQLGAPVASTRLGVTASARAILRGAESELAATVRTSAATVTPTPQASAILVPPLEGSVIASAEGVEAGVVFMEPGARGEAYVRVAAGRALEFAARALVPALGALDRLTSELPVEVGELTGAGRVLAVGRFEHGALDATVEATGSGVRAARARVSLGSAHVSGRLVGPPSELRVDARASGAKLALPGVELEEVRATVLGPLTSPRVGVAVTDALERHFVVNGTLDRAAGRLRAVDVGLERGSARIAGKIASIGAKDGALVVDDIEVAGLGAITGGLRFERGELVGKLTGRNVRLDDLGKLVSVPYPLSGTADLDFDLKRGVRPNERFGRARVSLHDLGMLVVRGVNADVELAFDGTRVTPSGNIEWRGEAAPCEGTFAKFTLGGEGVDVRGALTEIESLRAMTGSVGVSLDGARLRCIADVAATINPTRPLPLETIEGTLAATLELVRDEPNAPPRIRRFAARTDGLALAPAAVQEGEAPAWKSDRLDVAAEASLDPAGRDASLTVRLLDAGEPSTRRAGEVTAGPLIASLDAHLRPDLARLADKETRRAALLETPIEVALHAAGLDELRRAALPQPVRDALAKVQGKVAVSAFLSGTASVPHAAARVKATGLALGGDAATPRVPALDVDTMAMYEQGELRVVSWVTHRERQVAAFDATVHDDLGARLAGRATKKPRADVRARFDRVPLEALPELAAKGVRGRISGRAAIHELGGTPRVAVRLDGSGLRVRDVEFERASLVLSPTDELDPSLVSAVLRLEARRGGSLQTTGYGRLVWDDGPSLDEEASAGLFLTASRFPLRTLEPLFGEALTRVEGEASGEAHLGYKEALDEELRLAAALAISKGGFHVPALGQEFHGVSGVITTDPKRPGTLLVQRLEAAAQSGRITGEFEARLGNLAKSDITGTLSVLEGEAIPLVLGGQSLGTVRGDVVVSVARRQPEGGGPSELDVVLAGTNLRLRVPPSSGGAVQQLDEHPYIAISHPVVPPVTERDEAAHSTLTIALAGTTIEGPGLVLRLSTVSDKPVHITNRGEVGGEITLDGGELDVMGKKFRVDRGVARLRSEAPGNPYVNVTTHWEAPDGTVVFCDYVGDLKPVTREKLRFRSEPPRPESAVLSLVLFGDSGDDSGRAALGSRADSAASAQERLGHAFRGAVAAQFNALFGEVLPGFSTGIGATPTGYVATSVSYQLSERLSAQAVVEQASGSVATTTSGPVQEAANETRAKLGVDWRFAKNWLLRGLFGLGGADSGVDLLYLFRY